MTIELKQSSTLPMPEYEKRFLDSEVSPRAAQECLFHVVPVPYEGSVSYGGGTAHGPKAILDASDQLELFDGTSCPGEYGIFTHCPIDCHGEPETIFSRITGLVREIISLSGKKIPVILGGEHSLSYGALAALKEKYGRFGVVQFDAHADLRDTYLGSRWSHACAMRRVVDDLDLPLVQFGNRAFCLEEADARVKYNVTAWDAAFLARNPMPAKLLPEDFPQKIFISFDVDGLDPSIMAETGTPVAGGLQWYQALDLAQASLAGRELIGFDVVELAPRPKFIVSDFTAAQLVYALMGMAAR